MKTHKRYLALLATLALTASLPLAATKRKNNPVSSSDETEDKKYKITPKQIPQDQPKNEKLSWFFGKQFAEKFCEAMDETEEKKYKITPKQIPQDQPKSEKLSGFLAEQFYEAIELIKKFGIILNTTYKQEKNTPIDKLPENSLRRIIKNNNITEDIFSQQLKTYFCSEAIQFFTSWCETTKDSEENDQLFENVINYTLEHKNDGNFSIYNQIKEILDKEKIQYPTIEEFNKTCTEQDPKKRRKAWIDYTIKTAFHSDTISISDFQIFKKCIDETAQDMGVEIKSIYINACNLTGVEVESKKLYFDINEILYNHYTDDEIKANLQHECTHLKNNDYYDCIQTFVTSFTSFPRSTSKENLMDIINDENPIKLIQQNTTFIFQFFSKIKELFADKGVYDKNNMIHFITSLTKDFIELREIYNQADPITINSRVLKCSSHIPLKQRIIFWAKKLLLQNNSCSWDTLTKQTKKYEVTAWFPMRQEYLNFAINMPPKRDFIDIFKKGANKKQGKTLEESYIVGIKALKKIFLYAIKNENLPIIQELFKSENKTILDNISNPDLNPHIGRTLIYAAKNGYLTIVQEFFKPDNKTILENISKDDIRKAFELAAQNDRLTIIEEFFKSENKTILDNISKDDLRKAFELAAQNGRLTIIKGFFKSENKTILGNISKDDLEWTLIYAAKKGYLTIVQEFFKPDNKTILENISKDNLGWTLIYATKKGYLTIVQEFFKPDNKTILENISKDDLEWALKYAAGNGKITIVQEFLNNKIVMDKISQEDLKTALNATITDEIKNEINKHIKK